MAGHHEFSSRNNRKRGANGQVAPVPGVRMTTGSARVGPKPTLTGAGHGSPTALTLTAMGRLPKVSSRLGSGSLQPDCESTLQDT